LLSSIPRRRPAKPLPEATNTFERNFILRSLEKQGWNVTATARYLGIPLSTLKFKMDRLEIRELAKRCAARQGRRCA
jgi:DNA-binding NtrC family response regulator